MCIVPGELGQKHSWRYPGCIDYVGHVLYEEVMQAFDTHVNIFLRCLEYIQHLNG